MQIDQFKKLAAEKAVEEIESGMIIGLGSGSTFKFAIERISERIKNGELKNILGIPSSIETERNAIRLGIPLTTFDELITKNSEQKLFSILNSQFSIDLTIDGADEIDQDLNLIKGGGGKLLREKVLAQASKRLIIVVDESKLSKHLGQKFSVPIEVIPFAVCVEKKFLESIGAKIQIRKNHDGSNYITDENNFILDASFGEIKNVKELSALLNQRAGIVEHGIFISLAEKVYCAGKNGIEVITRTK
jgi:ribose 5-phosphate isomerase A